jgi:putative spermidine/putrescine transport system ATP-binding protein
MQTGVLRQRTSMAESGVLMQEQGSGSSRVDSPDPGAVGVSWVDVSHSYGDVAVLDTVALDVRDGEFLTLLGASGSGKSTLLRIVAGLLNPTRGHVRIYGNDVTRLPVQQRNIGFVFQDYALFPHMTAWDNVSFPLQVRRVPKRERDGKIARALDLVQMGAYADRFPDELSGGQQQRIAVARAISFGPSVLLLDEPLGALDRRLRQQLGYDLRQVHMETRLTTIYVTHDQEEAFTLSDRLAVLRDGKVQQVGTPREIYLQPANAYVSRFVGDINLMPAGLVRREASHCTVQLENGVVFDHPHPSTVEAADDVALGVRPEHVRVWSPDETAPDDTVVVGLATVDAVLFRGSCEQVILSFEGGVVSVEIGAMARDFRTGEPVVFGWRAADSVLVRGRLDRPIPVTRDSQNAGAEEEVGKP